MGRSIDSGFSGLQCRVRRSLSGIPTGPIRRCPEHRRKTAALQTLSKRQKCPSSAATIVTGASDLLRRSLLSIPSSIRIDAVPCYLFTFGLSRKSPGRLSRSCRDRRAARTDDTRGRRAWPILVTPHPAGQERLAPGPSASQDMFDPRGEEKVHNPEKRRDNEGRDQHDDGRRDGLLSRRPGDFLDLDPHLSEELKYLFPGFSHSFITYRNSPFLTAAPYRGSMAGQEGFEPPAPGFGVRCSNR
jgi:hypothetical protein